MSFRAYVGNIPFSFTPEDLTRLFSDFGPVRGAEVISDRATGRSRGFGFVEMETAEALNAAMQALNGKAVGGRPLAVNEARERTPRGPGEGGPRGPRPAGGGGGFGGPRGPRPGAGGGGGFGGPRPGGGGGKPDWERKKRDDEGSNAQRKRREYEERPRGGRWGSDEEGM
jgi:RNA recognition motif-containing protein